MAVTQIATPNSETIWAILQRVSENQEKTSQLIDELRESQKESKLEF